MRENPNQRNFEILALHRKKLYTAIRLVEFENEAIIKSMEYIFETFIEWETVLLTEFKLPSDFLENAQWIVEVRNRFEGESQNYELTQKSEFEEKFLQILPIFFAGLHDSLDEPDLIHALSAQNSLNLMNQMSFLVEPHEKDRINAFKLQLEEKIHRFKNGKSPIRTIEDYKKSIFEKQWGSKKFLFDIDLIRNLDGKLRGLYFEEDSPFLLSVLILNEWQNNSDCINWVKDRYSLFHLFYIMNENRRLIFNGTLTKLIAQAFTFKGEVLSEISLVRLFQNI